MNDGWVRTVDRLPEEGVLVDTLGESGAHRTLKCVGGGVWLIDAWGGEFVIYRPEYWRPLPAPPEPVTRVVSWQACDCEVTSKYCHEHHTRTARIPAHVLNQYESN